LFRITPKPYSLQFKWAVVTGLRRFELCQLRISDIPKIDPLRIAATSIVDFPIRRKGWRDIPVYVPLSLIEETQWYVLTERPHPAVGNEDVLFLTPRGKAVAKRSLSAEFRRVATAIGSKATLHHLRHTFAVYTLQFLQRRAEAGELLNPLKTLQILMGHSSLDSTQIYLRALDVQNEAVEEALAFLYGGTV